MLSQLLGARLGPYRRIIGLMVVFQAIQTACTLALPTLNAHIIDNGILQHDQAYIRSTGMVMLGFSLVQVVFASVAVYLGAKVAMGFGRDVRNALFHTVTDFSAREVGRFGAPSLITRITNDVQQVQLLVVMACTMAIAAPITLVVGLVAALRQDVGLSVVLVVSVPVAAIVLGILVVKMVPAFRLMQERIDQINRVLREQITGIRVVRAFVREPEEKRALRRSQRRPDRRVAPGRPADGGMFPTVNLVINMSSVGGAVARGVTGSAGQLQVGSLVAYLSYLVQILMSVVMATFMVSMIPRASVSAGRIQEVLDTDPTVAQPRPSREVVSGRRVTIEFRDVGFHYPGAEHPVLTDISFTTAPGQTTAIVGSTGAGKTTLLQLIPRLFDATAGSVLLGGVDVRDLDTDVLWSTIGLVPATPVPLLGDGGQQPALRQARRHRGRDVGGARGRPGRRLRAPHARRPATPASTRAAPTSRAASASGWRSPGPWCASRTSTSSTTRSRRSTWPPTPVCAPRSSPTPPTAPCSSWPSGSRPSPPPTRSSCSRTASWSGMGTDEELRRTCPTYAEIVQSQIGEKEAA